MNDNVNAVTELSTELEVRNRLALFARMIDGRKWNDIGHIFADDVSFNYGQDENKGIDALSSLFRGFLSQCGPTQHLIGSVMVTIDQGRVVSRAYVQARHQGIGEKAALFFDTNGEYIDLWDHRPEGWRIIRRDVVWAMHMGDPAVLSLS